MIILEKVNKYFNKRKKNEIHVINNTTLKLENTGLVALLGPSGCGKTTLLNVIGGLDKVNKGKIYINNQRITKKNAYSIDKTRNINIGYIFQDYKLIDNFTVFENVEIVLKMVGIKDKKEIKKRVDYVLNVLNIYRYRNRYANMLSGGERQRVGIARAIVKDPDIILADEPTGNLDSKNTLEIMNIIKSISKNRLVILVTHETDLAHFYASRVIELEDGNIVKDYENDHTDQLDYRLENNIYLKDFKSHVSLNKENMNVEFYSDGKENIDLDIIVRNGNFYIKSNTSDKIEIINSDSNIELINDNYKKMNKSEYQKYEFNFSSIIDKTIKKRYSSIFNVFTSVKTGFKQVFNYSFTKKLLLLGFLISSMFIMFSLSRIFASLNVEDKDFVTINKNYLQIKMDKLKVNEYLDYEKLESVGYMLPGDSTVNFNVYFNDYYQTVYLQDNLSGSLSSTQLINETDLLFGRMPENNQELVVDVMSIKKMFNNYLTKNIGIDKPSQMLDRVINIPNMSDFVIVGIVDLESPSIYVDNNHFINILSNTEENNNDGYFRNEISVDQNEGNDPEIYDVNLFSESIVLKKGKLPINDYEIIVNYENRYSMPLNKTINQKVNGIKLKVVGYYTTLKENNNYLTTNNTIKYNLIKTSKNITIYSQDKENTVLEFREKNLNIADSYIISKEEYSKNNKESVLSTIVVSIIIISISLVEIFLMIRASFLSRIKEIGIYRAIGVKKSDIYKMFKSEIIAITVLASIPGILFMSYILSVLNNIELLSKTIMLTPFIIILAILICFVFNLIVGLIPIFTTLRKTPAQILARNDLE